MIETKLKLWRGVAAATLVSASALSLAACGGEAGEEGEAAGTPAPAVATGEGGEGEGGEGGGEAGEAGISGAFTRLSGAPLANARLQQLKGFVLVAQQASEGNTGADAGVLVDQGLLEVHAAHEADFAGADVSAVRAAGLDALDGQPRAVVSRRLAAAIDAISAAQGRLDGDPADIAARMVQVATGLYAQVNSPAGVDPLEYQHAFGAALAARDALTRNEAALRARNAAVYEEALGEVNRLVALFPTPTAPERPSTMQQVSAQSARATLALGALKSAPTAQ
ncbi:MAG: hypothetical protein GC206_16475 [Alphaproteobacteria bacterium]|nr:hypothetical protein [Alphaproteobacteria bacterium]